jgi:murein L,D-transpeptidase YafK
MTPRATTASLLLATIILSVFSCKNMSKEKVAGQPVDSQKLVNAPTLPIPDTVIYEFDSSIYVSKSKFKTNQLKQSRVIAAYKEKGQIILSILKTKKISLDSLEIFIRVLKEDEILEVWGKNKEHSRYKLLATYNFSANSGRLGPKRQEGDYQIPEGFYYIDRFNPYSAFYLSLGINYPNQSDRILGVKNSLGGDIFLHGSEVTIGCVPITDDKIMELYLFAVEAKDNGQAKIPVHIFPTYLDKSGLTEIQEFYDNDDSLIEFWKNLQEGYLYFEENRILPRVSVLNDGRYFFQD